MLKDLSVAAATIEESTNLEDLVDITEDFHIMNMLESAGEVIDDEDDDLDEDDDDTDLDDDTNAGSCDNSIEESSSLFDSILKNIS
jgi:hypothetical protein